MITIPPIDWAYIVTDPETGFSDVMDMWDGLLMASFDDLDEALDYCQG